MTTMDGWLELVTGNDELLQMGHLQRKTDRNLGMGWLYYALVRLVRPTTVVVIGSWRGFAPIIFGKAMLDNVEGGEVVFVDPSLVDEFWKDAGAVDAHFARYGARNVTHHLMTTQQFVATDGYRRLGEVGLVFVDGYHTAEQARFDFDAFIARVPSHGYVLLHDSGDEGTTRLYGDGRAYRRTVARFVRELAGDPAYQVLELPFAHGLTLVRPLPRAAPAR